MEGRNLKKKTSLIIAITIVIGVIGILLLTFFRHKDMEIDDIIWTSYISDENGIISGGKIYVYKDGQRECIANIALSNVSMGEEQLLVGVQNLYPNAEGFKGIITYNISQKEVNEILSCDRIYDFLGDSHLDFCGNVQMTGDGKLFYFVCGGKMILYDVEKDELEVLFETSCYQYMLNESETYIYYSENKTLFRYNILDRENDILIDEVNNFSVSKDENIIIYENRKEQGLFLYQIDSGKNEKLVDLNYVDSQISISEDNCYLLYTDYTESSILTNRKVEICVFDLKSGSMSIIYKGNYSDNIRSVLWYL